METYGSSSNSVTSTAWCPSIAPNSIVTRGCVPCSLVSKTEGHQVRKGLPSRTPTTAGSYHRFPPFRNRVILPWPSQGTLSVMPTHPGQAFPLSAPWPAPASSRVCCEFDFVCLPGLQEGPRQRIILAWTGALHASLTFSNPAELELVSFTLCPTPMSDHVRLSHQILVPLAWFSVLLACLSLLHQNNHASATHGHRSACVLGSPGPKSWRC
jgi:hypothetical protein